MDTRITQMETTGEMLQTPSVVWHGTYKLASKPRVPGFKVSHSLISSPRVDFDPSSPSLCIRPPLLLCAFLVHIRYCHCVLQSTFQPAFHSAIPTPCVCVCEYTPSLCERTTGISSVFRSAPYIDSLSIVSANTLAFCTYHNLSSIS